MTPQPELRFLVTGATGFVGRALVSRLAAEGHSVAAVIRSPELAASTLPKETVILPIEDIRSPLDPHHSFEGIDVVIHLAAMVHRSGADGVDSLDEYRRANVEPTLRLAQQAAGSVGRFLYVSTAKVYGEGTDTPYSEVDDHYPVGSYAVSKHEAEMGLVRLAESAGLNVTILQPPLVYGPWVRANFLRLMAAVSNGALLPLGLVRNRRSLLFVGNLVDAIVACSTSDPHGTVDTFLVSDGEDVSSAGLVKGLARAMGRRPRLLPVPPKVLAVASQVVGAEEAARKLVGSFCVDSAKLRTALDWQPPYSLEEGLAATVRWYEESSAPERESRSSVRKSGE